MTLEENILELSRGRLQALRLLAKDEDMHEDALHSYFELKGFTSVRACQQLNLSHNAILELNAIDEAANMVLRAVSPVTAKYYPKLPAQIKQYQSYSDKELLDLIFKEGGRFNNPNAVAVAMFRELVDDIKKERDAYARLGKHPA